MTREEAKKRLEVWMICANCPEDKMCYDSHLHSICEYTDYCDEVPIEEAVKVAIEALEQKPKSECEHDHEILKAYSDGASAVLDNVRAEIESKYKSIPETFHHYETGFTDALEWVLSIIDSYKAEEGKG